MPGAYAEGFRRAFGRFGLPLSHMALEYVNGWAHVSAFVHGARGRATASRRPVS
jgi:hypothetical protein